MDRFAVSIEEAARLLSVSRFTVRRQVRAGRLRAVRVGRRVVILVASLQEFVQHGQPSQVGASREPDARN